MTTGLRSIAIKFLAFAVVSGLLLMLLVNTMRNGLGADSRHFTAEFTDVSGLRVGDDVKVAGVRVGRVDKIEVGHGAARVGFDLSKKQPLLDNTRIVMRYQNLVGQRYLALEQSDKRGAALQADATIRTDRTSPGFDLTELLNGFKPLFQVLQPADANQLATSIVKVLQGEGGTVEQLLQQTTELTGFFSQRDELYGDVVDNLTPVLKNLAGQNDDLSTTIATLKDLMAGLAQDRKSIGDSIDGVGKLVGSTAQFLRDVRAPAVAAIKKFITVSGMLADSRGDLNKAIAQFGVIFGKLGTTGSYENALNIYPCSMYVALGNLQLNPVGKGGPWSKVCLK